MHVFPKIYFAKKTLHVSDIFLCPSSGIFYCTFDIGIFLAGLMTASKQGQDGTVPSWPCLEAVIKPARNMPMSNVQ
jgi:hypothetical protein